jgi:WD40 repeat protein
MSWITRLVSPVCALVVLAAPLSAQQPFQDFEPYRVITLAFRPGSNIELLVGLQDPEYRLQAHLVGASADGRHTMLRTLSGFHAAVAWLDAEHLVTSDDKGLLLKWQFAGGNAMPFATLAGSVVGIGVAPKSRTLAVRMKNGPIRFLGTDGKPTGPALSLGRPSTTGEDCPPSGIETVTAFSADERLLVFAGLCGEVRVGGRDGARLMMPIAQRPYLKRHAFSTDGRTLFAGYTGQPSGGADIWPIFGGRLGNPKPLAGPAEHDDPADAAPLPDNAGFLVLSTNRVRFLGLDGRPTRSDIAIDSPKRVAISSDGTRIAVAAAEGIVLFDRAGKRLADRPFAEFGSPIAVAPLNGGAEFMALSREGIARFFRADGSVSRPSMELWDYTTLDQDTWNMPARLLTSPNGRAFAVYAPTGRFEVFDANWNRLGRPFKFPRSSGWAQEGATALLDDRILRPLPDGAGFVVFAVDGRVLGRLALVNPAKSPVQSTASANGVLATYSGDRTLRLWNAEGQLVRERAPTDALHQSMVMALSADGRTAVLHEGMSYERTVAVWQPGGRNTLDVYPGAFLRFLPDGRLVRVSKGQLTLGSVTRDVDAEFVHAVSDDGTTALVSKAGVARVVAISR